MLWKEALVDELWMNKIRIKWKAQVQLLVLHTHRARYLTDDTQPSYVRQPVGSAAWLGLGKVEEGSAFRSLGPRPACRKARTFRKIRISRILCTPSEEIRQSLKGLRHSSRHSSLRRRVPSYAWSAVHVAQMKESTRAARLNWISEMVYSAAIALCSTRLSRKTSWNVN